MVGDCYGAAGYIVSALARGNNKLLLCGVERQEMEQQLMQIKAGCAFADAELEPCFVEACWQADIILLQMENRQLQIIAERIRGVANRKLVIRVEQENVEPSSQDLLQQLLPNCMWVQVTASQANKEKRSLTLSSGKGAALKMAKTLLAEVGLIVSADPVAAADHETYTN